MKPLACSLLCLVLGIALPAASADEELGRLFHSRVERAALDAARHADRQRAVGNASAQVRIDGYVRRADGRATVWVNGDARSADAPAGGLRVAPRTGKPGVVAVQAGSDTPSLEVRVGSTLEVAARASRSATVLESGTRR